MIRFMLDTDQPQADYPPSDLFATYADLITSEAVLAGLHARHPGAVIVAIDRKLGDPLGMASVCDIEPGCFTPAEFPAWLKQKRAAGIEYATAYSDRSDVKMIDQAATQAGLAHDYFHWVATLDGTAHIAGFEVGKAPAAVQCFNAAMLGFHADGSLVFEAGWHPQPVPVRVTAARVELEYSSGGPRTVQLPVT